MRFWWFKYKDSKCSIQCLKFKASTCRLHFRWESHCHRSKRYPPFESGLPPPLGITEVPGVYFFPLLLCVGKFFFHPSRTSFFFSSSHVGQVFFSLLCVGQVFFFFTFEWVRFFFYKNFLLPPLKSNGVSLKDLMLITFSSPRAQLKVVHFFILNESPYFSSCKSKISASNSL